MAIKVDGTKGTCQIEEVDYPGVGFGNIALKMKFVHRLLLKQLS